MTVIRAAAVQLSPVLYSREGTVERVIGKIDQLARQDVQFATFPETVIPLHEHLEHSADALPEYADDVRV